MVIPIDRPKLEGNVAVGDGRQLGFAEFGDPQGRAVFWLHGTPGARRQIPTEARIYAEQQSHPADRGWTVPASAPPRHTSTAASWSSVTICAPSPTFSASTRWPSSGCPAAVPTLATAAAMPDRVMAAGVLGGVAPMVGLDAISSPLMQLGAAVAPILQVAGAPIRLAASGLIRLIRPVASPALEIYARISPEETGACSRGPSSRPCSSMTCSTAAVSNWPRPSTTSSYSNATGASGLDEVNVPVHWWHGDHDHIVPFAHGQHVVSRLPDAVMTELPYESHLGGLGCAEEIMGTMISTWDKAESD